MQRSPIHALAANPAMEQYDIASSPATHARADACINTSSSTSSPSSLDRSARACLCNNQLRSDQTVDEPAASKSESAPTAARGYVARRVVLGSQEGVDPAVISIAYEYTDLPTAQPATPSNQRFSTELRIAKRQQPRRLHSRKEQQGTRPCAHAYVHGRTHKDVHAYAHGVEPWTSATRLLQGSKGNDTQVSAIRTWEQSPL